MSRTQRIQRGVDAMKRLYRMDNSSAARELHWKKAKRRHGEYALDVLAQEYRALQAQEAA